MSLLLTAAIAATWIAIAALVFGIGAVFLRTLVAVERTWSNVLPAILCGIALLFAGLLLWHFFLPVNEIALLAFVVAGGVALVRERGWLVALFRARVSRLHAVPILIFVIWAANHALVTGAWDDYFYEFQAVRWFHDYPIVPGLANLHGRLGFNTAQHLYAAMLSVGPWAGAVNLLVNGPFVALAFALSWSACAEVLRGTASARNLFAATFIAPCVARYLPVTDPGQPSISTLKADVAGTALAIVCACLWLEFMDRTTPERRRDVLAATIPVTAATLFSIRTAAGPFVATLVIPVLIWMACKAESRRLLLPVVAVIALIIGAVPVRGIVLSGYPFYPSTFLAADVDWRVPVAQTEVERTFITTHAQGRSVNTFHLPAGEWVFDWARTSLLHNRVTVTLPLALACSLFPLFIVRRRNGPTTVPAHGWFILWGGTIGALVIWWFNAPSFRFAWGYLWILIASLLANVSTRRTPRALLPWPTVVMGLAITAATSGFSLSRGEAIGLAWPLVFATSWCTVFLLAGRRGPMAVGPLVVALGFFPIVDRLAAELVHGRTGQAKSVLWLNATRMPRVIKDFPLVERRTFSGLTIYEGTLGRYETPLPTTPYFNRYLELRRPPDLRGGFRNTRQQAYPLFGYKVGDTMSVPDE